MTLASLTSTHTVTIQRQAVTNTDAMGNTKAYTTGSRPSGAPTSLSCRIVPVSSRERIEFALRDIEKTHHVYSTTDPQTDSRDRLVYGSRILNVLSTRNPDELGRFYIQECNEQTSGVK